MHVYVHKYLNPNAFRVCLLWLILAITQVLKDKYNFSLTFASVLRYGRELFFYRHFSFSELFVWLQSRREKKEKKIELCASLVRGSAV